MEAVIALTGVHPGVNIENAQPVGAGFDELYEAHHLAAFRLALLLCAGERAVAEDAVGEALVHVLPAWRSGTVDDFGPYLRRAVVNQVNRTFRRRAVLRRVLPRSVDRGDGGTGVEEEVVRRLTLQHALRRLPLRQRTAVVLHYYAGLGVEAVAELMGTSVGTAKAHLSRGREHLRELLGGEW